MPEETQTTTQDELTVLKARAAQMGITHSNNITVETLRKKIDDHMEGKPQPESQINPFDEDSTGVKRKLTKQELRKELMDENMKLVRIRVANLDPKKKDLPGEILTVANEYIGTVKKYVPFGEATDNGYHVPYCIYKMMKGRQFLQISTKRDRRTGTNKTTTRYVSEFAIEVLEPLTEKELKDLATAQAASGSLRNEEND